MSKAHKWKKKAKKAQKKVKKLGKKLDKCRTCLEEAQKSHTQPLPKTTREHESSHLLSGR